ncbi:MAG: Zn-dependent hydrolase [Deltaproteobacteria bacterium]|nr:Zn-dependent hydrolase [Deltaproteobacteria bacterium]
MSQKKALKIEGPIRPAHLEHGPRIDITRLEKDIIELGSIGKRPSDGGVYRMAFSDADVQARKWLLGKIEGIGLKASMDYALNVFGLDDRAGTRSSYLIGSHLDSVPCAGVLDGALGVMVALECVRVIKEQQIELKENLELVATSDEEGRFGGMLGSQAICGELSLDYLEHVVDVQGNSLVACLEKHDLQMYDLIKARRHREYMSGFLELHIEQGPVLERSNKDIGIVEDISGVFKWRVQLIGEPNHSGTTPMDMRKDSFQGLCEFAGEIERILEENGSDDARATIGKVQLYPGSPHVIPGQTEFFLVGRDFDDGKMLELENAFRKALSAISRRRGLMFEYEVVSRLEPTHCQPGIVTEIEEVAESMNLNYMRMKSGAGHDAQIFGKYMPMGMIFIPSLHGISHSPQEWSSLEHIEMGANLLLRTILKKLQQ